MVKSLKSPCIVTFAILNKMISKDLIEARKILDANGVIGFPTETVYGLAGNIFSEIALRNIFEIKKRPFYNPLIVHLKNKEQLGLVAKEIPQKALMLAEEFWPGPLTLVLKKKNCVSDLVSAGKDTVAVRIPNHPMALELLTMLDYPLAAPSANPFQCISPTSAKHVEDYFGEIVPVVVDGGNCKRGLESTIIGFDDDKVILYRLGALSIESIESVVGEIVVLNENNKNPDAPGMLSKHYSPRKRLILTSNMTETINENLDKQIGVLSLDSQFESNTILHSEVLSKDGNLIAAASKLYAALHRLDMASIDLIIAERMPDIGIGRTMNDRLVRAANNERD